MTHLRDELALHRVQWPRGRASDYRLRKSCAAVLNLGHVFVILHCSSSHSCMNEYMAIDSGGYLYAQPSRINCSMAGCFPEKLRWHLIEQAACMGNKVKSSVSCTENWILRYENIPLLFTIRSRHTSHHILSKLNVHMCYQNGTQVTLSLTY